MSTQVKLSKREEEVLNLLLKGNSNKLIALGLNISSRTVEFHLKNIYSKFNVSSRVELILKLGNPAGHFKTEYRGYSTVVGSSTTTDNVIRFNIKNLISFIGREFQMKNLFNTKHVIIGIASALLAGLLWIIALNQFEHMTAEEILPWIIPAICAWILIGGLIGFAAKYRGSTFLKTAICTFLGTMLSPLSILPLMGVVVLPLGKAAEWLGLINRANISSNLATTLAIISMLTIWLIVGTGTGLILLFITFQKNESEKFQELSPKNA